MISQGLFTVSVNLWRSPMNAKKNVSSKTSKPLIQAGKDELCYVEPSRLARLSVHPYADSFRMLSEEKLDALAADIAKPAQGRPTGQQHPIIVRGNLENGEIVDGRNRLQACIRANVQALVRFVEMSDKEAIELICSLNNHRRQQNERAFAESAWKYKDVLDTRGENIAKESLAKMFGISRRTLYKWRPGGQEAGLADRKRGNNNNRYPISCIVRPTAHMLSKLCDFEGTTPECRKAANEIVARIRDLYSQQFKTQHG